MFSILPTWATHCEFWTKKLPTVKKSSLLLALTTRAGNFSRLFLGRTRTHPLALGLAGSSFIRAARSVSSLQSALRWVVSPRSQLGWFSRATCRSEPLLPAIALPCIFFYDGGKASTSSPNSGIVFQVAGERWEVKRETGNDESSDSVPTERLWPETKVPALPLNQILLSFTFRPPNTLSFN